jgi:hypothetical protein
VAKQSGARNVVDQLKDAIRESGRTLTDISKQSGIGIDRLSRFVRGERDLTGQAIAKVCEALDLELARRKPAGGRGKRK